MAHISAHALHFWNRLVRLRPLMGGIVPTVRYLLQARGKPFFIGSIHYQGRDFAFRNCDYTAVREVLMDAEYAFLNDFLSSSAAPCIVDVGAHIGTFSRWVYAQNPNTKLLAIEANPASHNILTGNLAAAVSTSQWTALNKAAWRSDEPLKFSTQGDSMGHKVTTDGDIKVSGMTFKDIVDLALQDAPTIDVMKIDIEGAEAAFFETAAPVLAHIDRLVIELHPESCNTGFVEDILRQYYTHVQTITGRIDSKPLLYCTQE